MSVKTVKLTLVAATATKIAGGGTGTAAVPVSVVFWNASAANVYVGGPDVTDTGATQGLPVAASSFSPSIDLVAGDDLYAYSTAGGAINVLTTRN